jgi:hypothetical protein
MKRREFLSALACAAVAGGIAEHALRKRDEPPCKVVIEPLRGSNLNQESLVRMLEAMKTDFVDRGKMIVVRPTKMLVTPEQYSKWCDAFGRAHLET